MSFFHLLDEIFAVASPRERSNVSPAAGLDGRVVNVLLIAWRCNMDYMTIHSMATMHDVAELDGRIVRRGVAAIVALAVCVVLVAALA